MLAYMCYTVVEKLARERAEWGCGKFSGTFSFSPGALRWMLNGSWDTSDGRSSHRTHIDMLRVARHIHESLDWFKFHGTCSQKSFIRLVVWTIFFMTFHILGMSSSQLTSIFFREVFKPPVLFYGCTCSRCWCCCWAWFWYFFVFLRVEEERLRHSVQGQTEQMEAPKVNSLTRRIGLYMNMVMKMNIMMLLTSSCIWCLIFETSVLFFICQSCCGTLGTARSRTYIPYVLFLHTKVCAYLQESMYVDIIHLLICRFLKVQMFGSSCGQVLVKPALMMIWTGMPPTHKMSTLR